MNRMRTIRAGLLLATLIFSGRSLDIRAQAPMGSTFRWLNYSKDSQLWSTIELIIKKELRPDIPEEVAPVLPSFCKWIKYIGLYNGVALVVVGEKEHCEDSGYNEYCRLFSIDTRSKQYKELGDNMALWSCHYLQTANYDGAPVPDVVFSFDDCRDCEAEHFITCCQYNPASEQWQLRAWPDGEVFLLIGAEPVEDGASYDCVYKIADFYQSGKDCVAIWCKESPGLRPATTPEETLLYFVANGRATKKAIVGKEAEQIHKLLCAGMSERDPCDQK